MRASSLRQWFIDRPDAPAPWVARAATIVVIAALLAAVCWSVLSATTGNWESVWAYRQVFWNGWLLTIGISALALGASLVFGVAVALARRSTFLPLRSLALIYIELFRGSPLIVLILFGFYGIATAIHADNRLLAGVVILSIFSSAYIAEMIRAGIESVGQSQLESARAIGLTPLQTYRHVIFPQAFRQTLPPLAGQLASLIKDSSLLSIIGLEEFTFRAQQVNSATLSTLESYFPLLIGYLVLTIPISLLSRMLEERFRYDT